VKTSLPKLNKDTVAEFNKGSSVKDVRSQGEGALVQCGHFATRGFFRCGHPHFFEQIPSDFRNLSYVRTGKGGLSQCGHFFRKKGVNFSRFCEDFFLWTATNVVHQKKSYPIHVYFCNFYDIVKIIKKIILL